MDWDNHGASFKLIGDSLIQAKVITEDNPKVIVKFLPQQVRVSKKKDLRVEVFIEDAEPLQE